MSEKKDSTLIWLIKYVAPFLVVFAAFCGIVVGIIFKPAPEVKETPQILPAVEVFVARSEPIVLEAKSQGVVQARTETLLVAEVSGRIQGISNSFFAGGYFRKGDPLVEIDSVDYKANLAVAKSRLAEANLAYQQEKALAEQAKEDWDSLNRGQASDLTLRKPQLERAEALLESARAGVEIAERDLERTQVRAPYDGRIREKFVDVGQMLTARQSQLARIYSTDTAEVRLPIALSDIEYLELPETYSNQVGRAAKPKVTVSAEYGGERYSWEGVIDRTEGAIDPRTRLAYVVAQIENPYEADKRSQRPPLKVGLFVEASIEGKRIEDAMRIPRKALQEDDTVYVVTSENRLEFKPVDIYKTDTEWAIITGGLSEGDRICVTPLEYAVMGMSVELDTKTAAPSVEDEGIEK